MTHNIITKSLFSYLHIHIDTMDVTNKIRQTILKIRRVFLFSSERDIVRFIFGLHAIDENSYCFKCDALILPLEVDEQ